jgi:short-subunit dehydrogenase
MTQDINSIIITASSHGLGLSIAKRFSERYRIILHGRRAKAIDEATSEVNNVVASVEGDLRDSETHMRLHDLAVKHNTSVLINNAAIPCYGIPLEEMSHDQIMESLSTNLVSPIALSHKLYYVLRQNAPGGIININSVVGIEPKKNRSVHSATKWGLRGFSKSLRLESHENNMRIMNVYPTRIMTTPEFAYGLDPDYVSDKIYEHFHNPSGSDDLVIDGRPLEYQPEKKYEA